MSIRHRMPLGTVIVEAERHFPAASIQLSHLHLVSSRKSILTPARAYRLDLSITPRLPSRMRFDRWPSSRFERPGRLFVVPPNEPLAIWNDLGRETVIVCHLFTEAMQRWLDDDFGPAQQLIDASLNVSNEVIEQAMLKMANEVCNPGFAADVMVEALAMQVAVELRRHYRQPYIPAVSGGLAPSRLRQIDERLNSSDTPPSLSELGQICGLSVRQLSRGFLVSRAVSVGQYVARHRLGRAKLLLSRDRSVKQVASQLGFTSPASFCAAFRKATGLTPSTYRRMASSGSSSRASRQDCDAMS
jgi:AraC family transcriptional regulator